MAKTYILCRSISAEELRKFKDNSLEISYKKFSHDSDGVGYCYAEEDPSEVWLNFKRDFVLVIEVTEGDYNRCHHYVGKNYRHINEEGNLVERNWNECSNIIPFTADTVIGYKILPREYFEELL